MSVKQDLGLPAAFVRLTSDETANDSDKTLTPATDRFWKIKGIYIEYTATGTGGNRQINVAFRDETDDIFAAVVAPAYITANQTRSIMVMLGIPDSGGFVGAASDIAYIPLPVDGLLPTTYDVRVWDAAAIDAAADDMQVHILGLETYV